MSQSFTDNVFQTSAIVSVNLTSANANFAALKSCFSGNTAPSDMIPGNWWYDTSTNILKLRNGSAWQDVWDFANGKPVITYLSNEITGAMVSSTIKDPAADTAGLRSIGITGRTACAGNDSRVVNAVQYNLTMSAGDAIVGRNDNTVGSQVDSYLKAKSFSILQAGTYRIKFNLKTTNSSSQARGRIYRNGVAIGSIQTTTSTTYVTKSADISGWSVGDSLELYISVDDQYSRYVYVENFRVCVDTVSLGVPAAQTSI